MRLVIVEDHLLIREAVRRACHRPPDHEVVGEAEDGRAGIEVIVQLKPDVVILDLGLPTVDGFAVIEAVRAVHPAMRFLVLSGWLNERVVTRLDKAGLHGFVDKGSDTTDDVARAVDVLAEGRTWFSARYRAASVAARRNASGAARILSDAELAVLSLVGDGLNDEEIGERLGIAPTTAQTHRSRILQKLQIKGTPKLVAFAVQHGFTRLPSRSPFPV